MQSKSPPQNHHMDKQEEEMKPGIGHDAWDEDRDEHDQWESWGKQVAQSTTTMYRSHWEDMITGGMTTMMKPNKARTAKEM